MNDPNGIIYHDGWWHLYYQHNPGDDEWGDIHWGHARSRDLIHWEHLPIALRPQQTDGELHCYSGCCALNTAGEPRILYTSVPPAPGRATQVLATPEDNACIAWTQQTTAPVLDLATHDGPAFEGDWRDPYVFQTSGRTFLILGACIGPDAVIALYENPDGDLRHWTYRGNLLSAPRTEVNFFECPSIVPAGDRWILFVSPCREVEWFSGTLDLSAYRFVVERRGRFDAGTAYYATHAKVAPDGRSLAFGWVQRFPKNRGWNGCLGVIREVWLDETTELHTAPLTELAAIQSDETNFPAQTLGDAPSALSLPDTDSCRGQLELMLQPGGVLHVKLAGVVLQIDEAGVRFDKQPVIPLVHGGRVQFEWLLDRSLLELFVNHRACYTKVITYPASSELVLQATPGTELISGRTFELQLCPGQSGDQLAETG